jgi:5-formyltetrahydrofolate cyclo-ligase
MDKKTLREEMLRQRNSLEPEKKRQADEEICRRAFLLASRFQDSPVLAYIAKGKETDLREALEQMFREHIRVAVPRVYGKEMKFHEIRSYEDLEPGVFGLMEPRKALPVVLPYGSLVLVPGLAFGPDGERLGYGAGYYDRYFSEHPGNCLIGICYDFQSGQEIPVTAADIPMYGVLTEEKEVQI